MTAVPVAEDLFELRDDGSIVLLGGYSPTSGAYHFPRRSRCPYTGAEDVEPVELSDRGALWAWTAVTIAPGGYTGEVPYGFGIVELPEGLRVVTRLTEADPSRLEFGQEMRLVADAVSTDDEGRDVVTWAFAVGSPPDAEEISTATRGGSTDRPISSGYGGDPHGAAS